MKHTGSHTITIDSFDNLFCNLIQKDHYWECSKCGNIVQIADGDIDSPPNIPCRNPLLSDNVPETIHNFVSNIQEVKNELCSVETIAHRYSVCLGCNYFQNNTCTECGCTVIRDRNYLNKIAIKTESCPIGLWKESGS